MYCSGSVVIHLHCPRHQTWRTTATVAAALNVLTAKETATNILILSHTISPFEDTAQPLNNGVLLLWGEKGFKSLRLCWSGEGKMEEKRVPMDTERQDSYHRPASAAWSLSVSHDWWGGLKQFNSSLFSLILIFFWMTGNERFLVKDIPHTRAHTCPHTPAPFIHVHPGAPLLSSTNNCQL